MVCLSLFAACPTKQPLTYLGAASQSITFVTAYDTLGEDGLRHSLKQTKSDAIFLDPGLIPSLTRVLKDITTVKHVIYSTGGVQAKPEDVEKLKSEHSHINIISIDELERIGEANPVDTVPPSPSDLCCIMYTSGSTGAPKGVPLSHENVVSASMFPFVLIYSSLVQPRDSR